MSEIWKQRRKRRNKRARKTGNGTAQKQGMGSRSGRGAYGRGNRGWRMAGSSICRDGWNEEYQGKRARYLDGRLGRWDGTSTVVQLVTVAKSL